MTQRVLIVQHDHCSPPGAVAERFRERGYEETLFQIVPEADFENPGVEVEFPDVRGFDAIVVMGSYWSAWDDDLIGSWLRPEMEMLREADEAGVPVLGICFGGQLLARTHGGSVARAPEPEIGFVEVTSEREELAPGGRWFAWHYDRWQLPPQGVEFARNAMASQGFILRKNLAVQFHPELSSDVLTGWCDNGGREMLAGMGRSADDLIAQARDWDERGRERAHAVVDGFLVNVASQEARAS
ncbi:MULTISPECIES: type 1 glutamine amidotransferase [Dermacoccus]|uniref:Type 1 glutamine amidotransferase n=2 Tax=Dermacoccus TaxID=57495 RepID=A0A417Z459_9MICO|nr:type 1 glutamine amidotransferase [Dermacoccus abyssi]RHW45195.1 type 1 glutamine amidotransferase [Dermacoccus abyssi]